MWRARVHVQESEATEGLRCELEAMIEQLSLPTGPWRRTLDGSVLLAHAHVTLATLLVHSFGQQLYPLAARHAKDALSLWLKLFKSVASGTDSDTSPTPHATPARKGGAKSRRAAPQSTVRKTKMIPPSTVKKPRKTGGGEGSENNGEAKEQPQEAGEEGGLRHDAVHMVKHAPKLQELNSWRVHTRWVRPSLTPTPCPVIPLV